MATVDAGIEDTSVKSQVLPDVRRIVGDTVQSFIIDPAEIALVHATRGAVDGRCIR